MTSRNSGDNRANIFLVGLFLLTGLITYRLFNLTFAQHSTFVKSAQNQYNNPSALLSGRGNIYFSDLSSGTNKIVATNRSSFYLYSNNKNINSAKESAEKISPIIKQNQEDVENILSDKSKSYMVIARNLNKDQAKQINDLKLKGLTVASEVGRYYAGGSSAAHTLGFVGYQDNQRVGRYGVEAYYDDILSGETKTQDLLGNKTYSDIFKTLKFWQKGQPAKTEEGSSAGDDLVLTIDQNIQSLIELSLDSVLKKWHASKGTIIVEDPTTGAILGMASSPSFDPNSYSSYQLQDFINPAVQEVFEPGSSFKPITMSAAVDSGAVTPDTTYNDTGEVKEAGYTIKNFNEKANGIQTMRQVLEHSLNTGAIFAEQKTGDDAFLNYVVSFGFGQKSGIDLSGEVSGNISNLYSGHRLNFLTASFGQGIAVSPIQLVNAYSAIANGGKLMKPFIIKEILRPDGTSIETKPKVLGAPITEKTSEQIKSMLADVVEKGFDKARIKGYDIAGKTGTAQIPSPDGGYLGNDQFIHDFLGFAPAYSPRFVVLIKMEKPQGIKFAADSLSPVFGDIARYLIRYFNIPPTRK